MKCKDWANGAAVWPLAHFERLIALAAFLAALSACEAQRKQDVSKLKESGRKPSYGLLYEQSYLLQDGTVDYGTNRAVKIHTDASGRLTWVQFDTSRGARVSGANLKEFGLQQLSAADTDFLLNMAEFSADNSQVIEMGDLISVFFLRRMNEYQVRDEFVQVVYASQPDDTFSLREIINRTSGLQEVANLSEPKVSFAELAAALGRDDIIEVSAKEILFAHDSLQGTSLQLCTEITYQDRADGVKYSATLINGSQEIIELFGYRHFATHQLSLKVLDRSYLTNREKVSPLAFATLWDQNMNPYSTNADGEVDLPATGTYTLSLEGQRGTVVLGNQNVPSSLPVTIDQAQQVIDVQGQEPYLNAFASLQEINRFARRHLRGNQAAILDTDIRVAVGYVPGACNAYYSPGEKLIALFPAGTLNTTDCADTALVHDIFHHEYGHALDDALGLKQDGYGILDDAFSEGIGDILASYYSASPNLGEGFYVGNSSPVRSANNNFKYPDDLVGAVHRDGQIIGGAFWDLRQALIARYSAESGPQLAEQLFFCHLQTTNAYVDSYQGVLSCDDDDGNPATLSRNHCLINSVFSARGLAVSEEDCVDQANPQEVLLDRSLGLGMRQKSIGIFDLYLSSASPVSRVYCCLGRRLVCEESTAEIAFSPSGTDQESGALLFAGQSPVLSPEQQELSCFSKDFDGRLHAAAQFKVVRK